MDESLYAISFTDEAPLLLPSTASPALSTSDDDSSSSSAASFSSSTFAYDWPTPTALPTVAQPPLCASSEPVVAVAVAAADLSRRSAPRSTAPIALSPSDAVAASKKRKVAPLSAHERLLRRRAQHRAVDASRRQRETYAIERLRSLTAQQKQLQGADEEVDSEDDNGDEEDGSAEAKKIGRLTVLDASIALIEKLTAACKRMEAVCDAKDSHLSHVSNQLHTVAATIAQTAVPFTDDLDFSNSTSLIALPPSSSSHSSQLARVADPDLTSVVPAAFRSYMQQADRSHTLSQTGLNLLSSMCAFVMSVQTHIILDANAAFCRGIRARRSDLLYQPVERIALDKQKSQYPASVVEAEEVMRGLKRRANMMWRCRTWDGRVYEASVTFFGDHDVQPEWAGQRKPERMMVMYAPEDVVYLDDFCIPASIRKAQLSS